MADHLTVRIDRIDHLVNQDIAEALLREGSRVRLNERRAVRILLKVSGIREHLLVRRNRRRVLRRLNRLIGHGIDDAEQKARDHRDQHEAQGIAHKRSFFCLAHAFFAPLLPNAFGMVALSMSGESMLPMIIEYETPSAPVPKIRKRPVSIPIISA